MLKHDIKRIFFSRMFWIAVALIVLTGIVQQFSVTNAYAGLIKHSKFQHFGALNRYIYSTCGSPNSTQLRFLLSIIIALPCANLYLQEKKSNYFKNVLLRTNRTTYAMSKLLAAGLMGGAAVLAALLVLLAFSSVIDPHASGHLLQASKSIGQCWIANLYDRSMLQFALFESVNLVLFGFVFSIMTLGFSILWNNKYLAYATVFLFSNIVISELHNFLKTPWVTGDIALWDLNHYQMGYTDVLIQYAAILLISSIVFYSTFMIRSHSDV